MAQPVGSTSLEIQKGLETTVGELLRQGVYFEQLLAVLKDHLFKRKIILLQYEQGWIVAELVNKIPRQRETFPAIAEAVTYALELYDKHE